MPSATAPHVLAIDLGTSAAKVALVSATGEIAGYESRPLRLSYVTGGGVEQSPDDWWDAIRAATRALMSRGLVAPQSVRAVSCTSQWSGTVAVDERGQPLTDAIVWLDARGAPHVQRRTRGLVSVQGYGLAKLLRWIRLTGGVPLHSGKDSIAHILFLREERRELYERTYKFLEPMDYLNMRMTGRFAASYATITLHWATDNRDLRRVRYHDGLLRGLGVDKAKLPELFPSASVLGPMLPEVARALGLPEDVQVVMGTPDIHTAAVGSGAVGEGAGHLSLGSSSWICCHVPKKKSDLTHNMAALPSAIPARYLLVNEQESAGLCLSWLRDSVLFPQDALTAAGAAPPSIEEMIQLAATVPAGSERLLFAPWLNGERAPVDNHLVRGAFFNQSLRTTRAHLIRAVLEGVAYNARWLLGHVERFIGHRLEAIPVVGGGATSESWCQILADVLERPIRQLREPLLANVRGAAFIGAAAMRYISFDEVPEHVPVARTFEPSPTNRVVYDALYPEYLALYSAANPICTRLNRP